MNCKPGDLAVFVSCVHLENIGGICRVVDSYRCDAGEWRIESLSTLRTSGGIRPAGSVTWADDSDLRPLRDSDGVDETLREREAA